MTGFETVTHARIRAAQGDRSGARRIARAILARDPEDAAARELLEALGAGADAPSGEPEDPTPDVPVGADAAELAEGFRRSLGLEAPRDPRVSLSLWLDRVRSNRTRTP